MDTFLKKQFEQSGFDVEVICNEILLIKNFISQEEIDEYFKIINKTNEEEWFIHYTNNLKIFCMEKFGRDDVENLVKEGKFEVTLGWEDKVLAVYDYDIDKNISNRFRQILSLADESLELSGFGTLQRMKEGVELKSHTDQHTDNSIKYAAVLYLNNDYVDGEIFFENKNIELKPEPGTVLVFPGNDEFKHGVKHVAKGPIRYVLPGFIKVKDFYKNNKY